MSITTKVLIGISIIGVGAGSYWYFMIKPKSDAAALVAAQQAAKDAGAADAIQQAINKLDAIRAAQAKVATQGRG